jgi:hypothetical protein
VGGEYGRGVCCIDGADMGTFGRCGLDTERPAGGTVKNLVSWHPSLKARSLPSMPLCPLLDAAPTLDGGGLSGEDLLGVCGDFRTGLEGLDP